MIRKCGFPRHQLVVFQGVEYFLLGSKELNQTHFESNSKIGGHLRAMFLYFSHDSSSECSISLENHERITIQGYLDVVLLPLSLFRELLTFSLESHDGPFEISRLPFTRSSMKFVILNFAMQLTSMFEGYYRP